VGGCSTAVSAAAVAAAVVVVVVVTSVALAKHVGHHTKTNRIHASRSSQSSQSAKADGCACKEIATAEAASLATAQQLRQKRKNTECTKPSGTSSWP
jgi:hypothetical protein